MAPDYSLALEEARRGFDATSGELPALRTRATQLLGVSGLAASFVGGFGAASRQPPNGPGWAALGFFVVTAGLCLVLLWPRAFYDAPKPFQLVAWAETPDVTLKEMQKRLAEVMSEKNDANRERLDRLFMVYSWTVVALSLEIVALVLTVWSR